MSPKFKEQKMNIGKGSVFNPFSSKEVGVATTPQLEAFQNVFKNFKCWPFCSLGAIQRKLNCGHFGINSNFLTISNFVWRTGWKRKKCKFLSDSQGNNLSPSVLFTNASYVHAFCINMFVEKTFLKKDIISTKLNKSWSISFRS